MLLQDCVDASDVVDILIGSKIYLLVTYFL